MQIETVSPSRRSLSPLKDRRNSVDSQKKASKLVSNRVYVGNLSYQVGWQDLKDYMRKVGTVTHADVLSNREGRSKGCGIVEYETAEEAQKAIDQLSETDLMGRTIFVREDREATGRRDHDRDRRDRDRRVRDDDRRDRDHRSSRNEDLTGRSLFIGNLPYSVSWQDLKDRFRDCGRVVRADVMMSDGRSKGMGLVVFENESDARRAIDEFDNYEWQGRRIEVREDRFASNSSSNRYDRRDRDDRGRSRRDRSRSRSRDRRSRSYSRSRSRNRSYSRSRSPSRERR
ncbi:hypothetical protein BC833DRAFT_607002 [Globomyces pollinis-pini]|nr:hypothetical protein BC833DRAFT_607002 [Globomyces pollinis-pini]